LGTTSPFHLLKLNGINSGGFIKELRKGISLGRYFAMIDLDGIDNLDNLFKLFVEAFHFPDYFGYNWNAFDECMNDLDWIKAGRYILVLKNLDKLAISNQDIFILLRILKETAIEWIKGRSYNLDFPTPPTPFHIIFTYEEENIDKIIYILNGVGIQKIDKLRGGPENWTGCKTGA
jgi:hypothetical protein